MKYLCPICGYLMSYPADDFNICPSCGVEFGYETIDRSYSDLRKEWLASGANWASRVVPVPQNWNPYRQLKNFRDDFRPVGDITNSRIQLRDWQFDAIPTMQPA
jgi:hypothetical protein